MRELLNIVCDGYDGSNDEKENNFSSNGGRGERLGKEHTCTCIISNFNTLFLLKSSQTQWKMDGKFVVSMQDWCVHTGFP